VGAPDSFEAFVLARQAALLRTAYLLTGHAQDAEDLVQTTLIKVVPHWRRIADDPEPYVRRVLVHENVSRWRRRRWREVASDALPEVLAETADHDDLLAVRAALAGLAPRQRAVVVLRYYEDRTEAQTADLLGISVGTVKSHARDAVARLRLGLVREPVDER
jgi:RNA polymerase sigma-70 factor (sigma-E family)